MPIETLDDIIEEIADRKSVYGACPNDGNCEDCVCRCCWTASLKGRIEAACRIESVLARAAKAKEGGEDVTD